MLDPDPFPPPNAFFSLSLLGPVPLHANPCFLGTNFSIHLVKKGQKGGCWGRHLILLLPLLSLSLTFAARLASSRREDDEYKPVGLGVRLPRFCIKVDSNPSEIFSLSRPPSNPCNFAPFAFFRDPQPTYEEVSHSLGRRGGKGKGFSSRRSVDARDSIYIYIISPLHDRTNQ